VFPGRQRKKQVSDIVIRHEMDDSVPGLDEIFIGGQWCKPLSDRTWEVIDPSTEEKLTTVALPSEADANQAVTEARRAFDRGPWPRMPVAERVAIVRRWTEAMEARADDVVRAWAIETGIAVSSGEVINKAVPHLTWGTSLAIAEGLPWEEDRGDAIVRREPTGVVLAVLTYNGPLSLVAMKVVPALLAGCTVIVKHAPETQFCARIVAEAAREVGFPEGVLSFLPADTPVTQYLVSHEGIDMVTVTGSQAIARDVLIRTAPRLARTALELGGKSPAIIGEDADFTTVVPNVADGAQSMSGQICVALSRVLVPTSRYQEFADALVAWYAERKIGDPLDPSVWVGPLAVERAVERTKAYIAGAVAEGATIACGGKRPAHLDRGYFYEPTVLTNVNNQMKVAREEVFGPCTALIPYDGLDEAIEIANDTVYGLAASVYTSNNDVALEVARKLRSGTVGVQIAGMSLCQPFGGVKQSGWGRECGPEGILEFTDIKQVLVSGGASFHQAAS
jgi:acyl-CoA reductase-like NAD-dependent aldehyde dehydrogenase